MHKTYSDLVPNFSVVIPCFNSEKTIERAFSSVLNQTFPPREVIFIDDASTDGTQSLLSEIESGAYVFSIKVIKNNSNVGPGKSRNFGWDLATSTWIAFLDSDDAWHREKLEIFNDRLIQDQEIDLLCSDSSFVTEILNEEKSGKNIGIRQLEYRQTLFKNQIFTRTVVIRRSIEKRFRAGLSEDFSLWLDCLYSGLKVIYINSNLSFHFRPEFSPGGISSNLWKHELYELKAICEFFKRTPLVVSGALFFSIVKFFRRIFIRIWRRIRK